MDEQILSGLVSAFKAAPSGELAKVITAAYIEANNLAAILPYVDALNKVLSIDEFSELTVKVIHTSDKRFIDAFSETLTPENLHGFIESLVSNGDADGAKAIYLNRLNRDIACRSSDIDRLLGVNNEKARLRVVEKPEVTEVIDMARFQAKTTDFNDVVGLDKIKQQIHKKIILPFQKPSLFARFKKKVGGGVLLFGPPGCGKTLLARATAGECNASFFNIEASDILDMYIGESEQKLHAIFEKARNEAPSVLFFDELEALAGKREYARNSSTSNLVSQFLTELDGFSQNNSGVLVLASTNVPWAIDSAFLRPGRFDRMFFVPPPDAEARAVVLEHHMQGRPTSGHINFSSIARKLSGYSGADLANLIEMAADEAIDEAIETGQETLISGEHLQAALTDSRATTIEWLTTARNYARYANDGGRYNEVLNFLKKHGH